MRDLFTSNPFDPGFRFLFSVSLVLMMGRAAIYRRRAYAGERFDTSQEGGIILFLRRVVGLSALAYLILYIAGWRWLAWSLISLPVLLRWTGFILAFVVAPSLGEWTYRHLGANVSPTVVIRREHALVTTGPYRWVRHPLYLTGIVLYSGFVLISGSWLLLVLIVVGFVTIAIRTNKEEANLAAHFGAAYEAYRSRTGRFFPRL